jgi:2'-5' RNA ligase
MNRTRSGTGQVQPGLPGMGDAGRERHRLFLALLPDADACARMRRIAEDLQARYALTHLIRQQRYHVTVHFLGDNTMLRADQVAAAQHAAAAVVAAPFELAFDALANFGNRHDPACALRASTVPAAAQALWCDARDRLFRAGLGRELAPAFVPHVTLAHTGRVHVEAARVEPVVLRVAEWVLVHAVSGRPDYAILDRWPLAASRG